ncbi:MAG: hypothetical protein AAFW81_06595 [Pseudomonadota bacterium]
MMRKYGLWLLAGVATALMSTALLAQPREPRPIERIKAFLEERAQTRPRLAPPPIGRPPLRSESAIADWTAVQRMAEETRRRDASRFSSVAAATTVVQERLDGVRALSAERLKTVRPAEIERVLIPLLVPSRQRVLETVQVIGQPNAYTAIAEVDDGVDMRMSGSAKRLVLERSARPRLMEQRKARPPLPGLNADYVITRSESSTDLSFSRFNIGYVLSLICDEPDTDARCLEDDFIIELASSMALLNGPLEDTP